jgi:hypothetical protein
MEIPASLQPIPSVSLPDVPGLVNWPKDEYARLAKNHSGVPYVVREPADHDGDDNDNDLEPNATGKVSWSPSAIRYALTNYVSALSPGTMEGTA